MYFSSGRLEDLHTIKAFGIPNVEAFIADPSMFVHESNYWIAGFFIFLTIFAISLDTLCNDTMLMAAQPLQRQIAQWSSIGKDQQELYLNMNQVTEVKPGETPYQAVAQKMAEQLGDRIGTILSGLSIGALFFFPKAVLWTGIAYSITKIITKIPRIKIIIKRLYHQYTKLLRLRLKLPTFALVLALNTILLHSTTRNGKLVTVRNLTLSAKKTVGIKLELETILRKSISNVIFNQSG